MLNIYIDADACPVKDEIYKVAGRHQLKVIVVSNRPIRTPMHPDISSVVVGAGLDEADLWILAHIQAKDIVVTADIPLADQVIKMGARVLDPKGKEFTEDSIGDSLATREIMSFLRDAGEFTSKHPPFSQRDRSQFLSKLDAIICALKRS